MNVIQNDIRAAREKELEAANKQFPLFASLHEGFGVMAEEYDEAFNEMVELRRQFEYMWEAIKENRDDNAVQFAARVRDAAERLAIEAVQLSAMGQKMIDSRK